MIRKKIAVLGLGSAGVQSLSHFLFNLDNSWDVYSIHNPDISIVGIGESTNPVFVEAISLGLDFDYGDDLLKLNGTLKFGTRYVGWRDHTFINPLIGGGISIHLDTYKLKDFALDRLRSLWGTRFKEITGNVEKITNNQDSVSILINNKEHLFDYLIDCTGFPKTYDDYNIIKEMPVNDCLVHNVDTPSENPFALDYTDDIATQDGWMFKIPLSNRTSYGYLFNNNITSVENARLNFSKIINVPESEIQDKRYTFVSYYTKNLINNRIIKNGNAAVFFEPKFSNSLWLYDNINRYAFDYIHNVITQEEGKEYFTNMCIEMEEMIAYHYFGGSTINSPFWDYAQSISQEKLKYSKKLKQLKELPSHYVNDKKQTENLFWIFPVRLLIDLDKNFGYDMLFKGEK